ncbi:hypothetical protein [Streptomyces clavuligerus]|uniref:Secreted protein n=1 Tax=Streptomyces clavuligerus TaxID=1901 RepID=D5SJF1_STRCL|nr:hypothetical protein [Streptomyces clavuligerus]EFG04044.1 Hypothetical protein SCLAV_p0555 [Streptomyces clavuligerus]MBY6307466.1 hypothetical protein [Streptomyces clavuligerus]QCS09974.1 hypothetical protein CRV15_30785 [Streptomyces clavuligerus]QPJ97983.1 hypothetical protein GE265_33650 [Streptomyces clavuligerus]WDN56681.1 hypothetical protein LL058_33230 [Streptomyces clavuligerus]
MFRRTATTLAITLAGAALALGVSSTTATAAPAAAQSSATTAAAANAFRIVGYGATKAECEAKGRAGEGLWGKVWWCAPYGSVWAL